MPLRRDDRCGSRHRRGSADDEPHVPETEALGLTGLGEAFIDALKEDERFREVFADPFGEKQGPTATA
jgi:hypothetical protein